MKTNKTCKTSKITKKNSQNFSQTNYWANVIFYNILYLICLRRGSWRPIGHMRPSSPLLDSVRDNFEGQEQMAKDFAKAFYLPELGIEPPINLFDVKFIVGQGKMKIKLYGVRAILGVRSRYGFDPPGPGQIVGHYFHI